MANGIDEFDHLMFGCKDIELAGDGFARLGFTVGPITRSPALGTANRRVLLTPRTSGFANFIELIQFTGPPDAAMPLLARFLRGADKGLEGVRALIMGTRDAAAAHACFSSRHRADPAGGFEPASLMVKDAMAPGPDGEEIPIAFTNCILPQLAPPIWISISQIRSREFYLMPTWRRHQNGARSWVATIAAAHDPAAVAAAFQNIWGGEIHEETDGAITTRPGTMPLRIYTPQRLTTVYERVDLATWQTPPYVAGYEIEVADLDATVQLLRARSIDCAVDAGRVAVPPSQAHGTMICFKQDQT